MPIPSHQYAEKLKELAEFLESRPEFEISGHPYLYVHCYTKETFIGAVRAFGAGKKEFSTDEIRFIPLNGPKDVAIQVDAPRNKVCKLVREAVWDCDPLLTPDEEAEVGV